MLRQTENKLYKSENQLSRAKQMMKDLNIIKEDIVKMKETAQINSSDSNVESIITENEILKAKISELDAQINSLSRSDEEGRLKDRLQYENKINEMNEEQ